MDVNKINMNISRYAKPRRATSFACGGHLGPTPQGKGSPVSRLAIAPGGLCAVILCQMRGEKKVQSPRVSSPNIPRGRRLSMATFRHSHQNSAWQTGV
jgi:hypothetical protein